MVKSGRTAASRSMNCSLQETNRSLGGLTRTQREEGLPRKAEAVLQRQYDDFQAGNKRAALNACGFNAVIHEWAKAKEKISGERAELVLNSMVELQKQRVLKERPDAYSYNAVVKAWVILGEPDKAKEVFDRMLDDYKNNGNKVAKPNVVCFTSLLQAYSNAELPNAEESADALLEEMGRVKCTTDLAESLVHAVQMCWECSVRHNPETPERLKQELQATMDELKPEG